MITGVATGAKVGAAAISASGAAYEPLVLRSDAPEMSMQTFSRAWLALLACGILSSACRADVSAPVEVEALPLPVIDSTLLHTTLLPDSMSIGRSPANWMPEVQGFNYLTDCDALSVEVRSLTLDSTDTTLYAWLHATCASNKSYELLLVPQQDSTLVDTSGDARQLFLAARAQRFSNYTVYAALLPLLSREDVRAGTQELQVILPGRLTLWSFEASVWKALGTLAYTRRGTIDSLYRELVLQRPPVLEPL